MRVCRGGALGTNVPTQVTRSAARSRVAVTSPHKTTTSAPPFDWPPAANGLFCLSNFCADFSSRVADTHRLLLCL